ncbi:hypothetical protein KUCAC02_030237 [Chaenocephalus aceratus]|uniref:Uncharacterized protein n=1 Tax=Chaenocephalus aceratus TaxID=36190 RepID=A0ACB9XIC4_CHAAC|nr:hypothetical protein KUCAC02_030237 [Chaenocephalus aceratus]
MSTATFTSNGETRLIYNIDVLINRATIYNCYYACYTNRNNGANNVNINIHLEWRNKFTLYIPSTNY